MTTREIITKYLTPNAYVQEARLGHERERVAVPTESLPAVGANVVVLTLNEALDVAAELVRLARIVEGTDELE